MACLAFAWIIFAIAFGGAVLGIVRATVNPQAPWYVFGLLGTIAGLVIIPLLGLLLFQIGFLFP